MKPFYVKHANEDEAREIIELAVANGAKERETVGGIRWRRWKYVGVGEDNDTVFLNHSSNFGENATEMTIEEVRKMFEKKSDVSDEWLPDESDWREVDKVNSDIVSFGQGFMIGGKHIPFESVCCFDSLVEVKTKDEIKREEVITSMCELTFSRTPTDDRDDYGILYDAGFRFIANDEVIVKPLSDEQIETIRDKCIEMMPTFRDAIEIIQRELGVIE